MKVPVINHIPIPATFVSMISGTWIKLFAGVVYLGMLLIVFRLKDTTYYLIVADEKLKQAIKKSWYKNKHQLLGNATLILWLIGQLLLTVGVLMVLQYCIDYVGNLDISIAAANIFIVCLTGILYFVTAQWLLMFTTSLTIRIDQKPSVSMQLLAVVAMIATGGLSLSLANRFMQKPATSQFVMAHMGVTSDRDVQNAIENLHKVSATKPDYVEIDIQHTKDGVYVLSHDATIKATNGKKYKIRQTNWEQLQKVTYQSNGKKIKVSNFGDYLNEANRLNQRLLVELKINSSISNQ